MVFGVLKLFLGMRGALIFNVLLLVWTLYECRELLYRYIKNLPYRKAAYAASGLSSEIIEFNGKVPSKHGGRFGLAVDSLALYTDFGYKFSFLLAIFMVVVTFMELVYTVTVWCLGNPISGWTTIMFVITFGFTGLFAIMTIILKYLTLILKLTFRKQQYLINSIEKY